MSSFSRMRMRIAVVAAGVAAVAVIANTVPASAYTEDNGKCETREVCLWYNSYFKGGVIDFFSEIEDYSEWTFHGTGGNVNNNTASVRNYDGTRCSVQWQYLYQTGLSFAVGRASSEGSNDEFATLPAGYKNAFSSDSWSNCAY